MEAIVCAGVIVGVGGEFDPCVTQEQADRATRLIVRELNRYGLLRPAVATDEALVIADVLDEYDGDHIVNGAHVVTEIRAALNAAQSGGTQ